LLDKNIRLLSLIIIIITMPMLSTFVLHECVSDKLQLTGLSIGARSTSVNDEKGDPVHWTLIDIRATLNEVPAFAALASDPVYKVRHHRTRQIYTVLGEATSARDGSKHMVYRAEYDEPKPKFEKNCIWVRPKSEFYDNVVNEKNIIVKRFANVTEEELRDMKKHCEWRVRVLQWDLNLFEDHWKEAEKSANFVRDRVAGIKADLAEAEARLAEVTTLTMERTD
jgi:hypothetical protein